MRLGGSGSDDGAWPQRSIRLSTTAISTPVFGSLSRRSASCSTKPTRLTTVRSSTSSSSLDGAPLGLGPDTEGSLFDTGPAVVYISLDEVDSMHERAVAAGAEILMAPADQDYGSRDFVARDGEGNVWCFGTYQPGS